MLLGTMVHPVLIQGGMGAAISGWRLAREVSLLGQLGVVSGTAINSVMARRLQDGDPGGHVRRALESFPEPEAARAVIARYFQPEGRNGRAYRLCSLPSARPSLRFLREVVLGAFAEVFLAKEGHGGIVGINFLEKIQFPNLAGLYGALLAGVDHVLMGAGIPREIPGALERLVAHEPASLKVAVTGPCEVEQRTHFDPRAVLPGLRAAPLVRPSFLAIISSATLAAHLLRNPTGRIDGFVVELPSAGGHNAPPRGPLQLDAAGEPVYGPKDVPDLAAIRALGLPFWLAGSFGSAEKLRAARALGAVGIQVGTAFAFCEESGLAEPLRRATLEKWVFEANLPRERVRTDPQASPTAFPFKVVPLEHTLSDPAVYAARQRRRCDLGYLRQVVVGPDGQLVYRCPAEPVADYLAKGGRLEETHDRKCLCNALMANAGLAQTGPDGWTEPALVTAGDDLAELRRFFPAGRSALHAREVVEQLLA